VSSFPLGEII
jgi:hypothetical protein